ncbi:hypothetical protein [Comamonas faecalis]
MNLRPCCDYMANIKRVNLADPLQGIVQSAGKRWQAGLLPVAVIFR